jgi:hypothetical protein
LGRSPVGTVKDYPARSDGYTLIARVHQLHQPLDRFGRVFAREFADVGFELWPSAGIAGVALNELA